MRRLLRDLCSSRELLSIEWLEAVETGAVAIAEPDVDDSGIVGMQQPRKPLTPRSQFGKPIFCSSRRPKSVVSRYIPTLFRPSDHVHGASCMPVHRRDDEHGPNPASGSSCSAFRRRRVLPGRAVPPVRRRSESFVGDRDHCSLGSQITPIKLATPGMAVLPETDFLTSATSWKGGEHQTERDQRRSLPGSPHETTFARRTRERVLRGAANRAFTARRLRTEGFSF